MSKDFREIAEYWKKEYSNQITENKSYNASEQFRKMAAFFAPGNSYYYIVNFHDLNLELVSDSVKDFTGLDSEEVSMQELLATALPEEIDSIQQKENVIRDFFMRYLKKENPSNYKEMVLSYKIMYTYRMCDNKSRIRTILHQATPLSVLENGYFQHVFSVHSDISHFKLISSKDVSFVNLKGGESFYNINCEDNKFDPKFSEFEDKGLNELLTGREKEIIKELARGLSAKEIANELHLSPHTVRTHRKNMLQKSGCFNTAQLVAKCLTGGVISPSLN